MTTKEMQTFDTSSGKLDAYRVTESMVLDGQVTRRNYVEVFPQGVTEPDQMIAWFGDVESFARWIGEGYKQNW